MTACMSYGCIGPPNSMTALNSTEGRSKVIMLPT